MSVASFGRLRRIARTRPTASNVIFLVRCLQHSAALAATVVVVPMLSSPTRMLSAQLWLLRLLARSSTGPFFISIAPRVTMSVLSTAVVLSAAAVPVLGFCMRHYWRTSIIGLFVRVLRHGLQCCSRFRKKWHGVQLMPR